MTDGAVQVIRSADRTILRLPDVTSRGSFPFAGNVDLVENAHGMLLVHNEDTVDAGAGFDRHTHRDMEIITWVVSGSLVHRDSLGNVGVLTSGSAQRMTAGSGISHAEYNDSWTVSGLPRHRDPVTVVQMWIPPDSLGLEPDYQDLPLDDALSGGDLVTVVSGMARHAGGTVGRIRNEHVALHAARLEPGQSVSVPESPYGHVFLTRGAVDFEGAGRLEHGDAVRLSRSGGQSVTALEPTEVLIWEMDARAGSVR